VGELVVKKASRMVIVRSPGRNGVLVTVTFSCPPLREIRGLSLVTDYKSEE
jgi:hypothetical protein